VSGGTEEFYLELRRHLAYPVQKQRAAQRTATVGKPLVARSRAEVVKRIMG
jgi:hypothetical protein